MPFATMEGEIVDVNVGLNQVMRQQFSKHNFHLENYFKTGLSFVGLMWLTIKILFLARIRWNNVIWMSSHN